MPLIKCELYENNRVIEVVTKETNAETADLIASLESFRQNLNENLTKLIEDNGEIEDYINDEASSEDESEAPVSPKKRKK